MSDFRVDTGNIFADAMIERRIGMSPEYWALVDYLEMKGVLDREEFLAFFSDSASTYVQAVIRAHREVDD